MKTVQNKSYFLPYNVNTLWNVMSQQRNETGIQFLLCMIQKALGKHSNAFIVHVFKETWRWNYHSMNVSGYWSVVGKWRMLSLKMLEGWIWYTTTNKNNNNKHRWRKDQRINWAVLLRRDCHRSDYLQMLETMIPCLNDLFENENEVYFQEDGDTPHFVFGVKRRWRVEFGTPPPTRIKITRIRDKFEVNGAVMQVCVRSPKKSLRQYSREKIQCSSNFASSKMETLNSDTFPCTKCERHR